MTALQSMHSGHGDVIRPHPKQVWTRSLKAARTYANQWGREWVKVFFDRCVTCGAKVNLQWAHVLSGKGDAVRWHKQNMTRQCEHCNQLHEEHPEHLVHWFIKRYGQKAYTDLTIIANRAVKLTYSDIMLIGDELRAEVRGE